MQQIDYFSILDRWDEEQIDIDLCMDKYNAVVAPYVSWSDRSDCHDWRGAVDGSGRPTTQLRFNGTKTLVYRVVHRLYHGFWPDQCRHLCGNSNCVNPDHLFSGSVVDNALDTLFHDYCRSVGVVRLTAPRKWGLDTDEVTGEALFDRYMDKVESGEIRIPGGV